MSSECYIPVWRTKLIKSVKGLINFERPFDYCDGKEIMKERHVDAFLLHYLWSQFGLI